MRHSGQRDGRQRSLLASASDVGYDYRGEDGAEMQDLRLKARNWLNVFGRFLLWASFLGRVTHDIRVII